MNFKLKNVLTKNLDKMIKSTRFKKSNNPSRDLALLFSHLKALEIDLKTSIDELEKELLEDNSWEKYNFDAHHIAVLKSKDKTTIEIKNLIDKHKS